MQEQKILELLKKLNGGHARFGQNLYHILHKKLEDLGDEFDNHDIVNLLDTIGDGELADLLADEDTKSKWEY